MPGTPYVVPPLLLIVVLLVSAVAKLRDPDDTSSVFRMLELPPILSRLHVPRLLPYGELVVVAALLAAPGGWYVVAATATLLLFGAYLVVVVRALRLPWPVVCGCFGRLGLGEVTRGTVVRNVVLLAVAAITFADSWRREGVLQRMHHLGDGWWWLAGVALATVTTGFVVRGEKHEAEEHVTETGVFIPASEPGGYVGRPTPYAVLDGPDGLASVWQLTDTAARLLVFAEPADPDAEAVVAQLGSWADQLQPVVVHLVAGDEWRVLAERHPELAGSLLGDPGGEVRHRFGIAGRGAVLLGTDRFLAGGPVHGDDDVRDLVEATAEELRAAESTGASTPS